MTISGETFVPLSASDYLHAQGRPLSMSKLLERLADALWNAHRRDSGYLMRDSMLDFSFGLNALRAELSPREWPAARDLYARHPVNNVLRRDPLTLRAQEAWRRYTGHPELLDYFYRLKPTLAEIERLDAFALRLNSITTAMPVAQALRRRRDAMAGLIDSVASARPGAEILCVAAGHCRELAQSRMLRQGRVRRFVAFDRDWEALERIRREQPGLPLQVVCRPLKSLVSGATQLGRFDLI